MRASRPDPARDATDDPVGPRLEVVRGGLHRRVTEQLGHAIVSGELADGAQIVPEELGARLGVSRTVIRESLRVLMEKGMVVASPRLGTHVTPIERWSLLDPDVIGWRVDSPQRDDQLHELIALRRGVEPIAAALAAGAADDEAVRTMLDACAAMDEAAAAGDVDAFTVADMRFHSTVLAASGNLVFRQFARPIEAVLVARRTLEMMPPVLGGTVLEHHRSVTEAVAGHDAATAERRMRELIDVARDEIVEEVERRARGTASRRRTSRID